MKLALAAVVAAILCYAQPGHAETLSCQPIDSLPAVLDAPGSYCLARDLGTTIDKAGEAAIKVASDDVRIECNGFQIDGAAAGAATMAVGITSANKERVTVRNCRVRGFRFGINVYAGSGHRVEANTATANTAVGISVSGRGSVLRGNTVADVGGAPDVYYAAAITADTGVDVIDNRIKGVRSAVGDAFGILLYLGGAGGDSIVRGNEISDLAKGNGQAGRFGIYAHTKDRILFAGNTVLMTPRASQADAAIVCASAKQVAYGNLLAGVTPTAATPGCTATGNTLWH